MANANNVYFPANLLHLYNIKADITPIQVSLDEAKIQEAVDDFKSIDLITDWINFNNANYQLEKSIANLAYTLEVNMANLKELKMQQEAIRRLLQKKDKKEIIKMLKNPKQFETLINWVDSNALQFSLIKDTDYLISAISSLKKILTHCKVDTIEVSSKILYYLYIELVENDKTEIIDKIFTDEFNAVLMKRFKQLMPKNTAKSCESTVNSSFLGLIIRSNQKLAEEYKNYHKSLLLLDKL